MSEDSRTKKEIEADLKVKHAEARKAEAEARKFEAEALQEEILANRAYEDDMRKKAQDKENSTEKIKAQETLNKAKAWFQASKSE